MKRSLAVLSMPVLLLGCEAADHSRDVERKARAERFFRGVYGCDPSVVDELGADNVVVSYPVFAELYDTPALRGREAVRGFAERFCSRWKEARFTFHEGLADGDNVVLVWSFRARFVGPESPGGPAPGGAQGWGGITLYQFDDSGKIAAEIGEESAPGPMARVAGEAPPEDDVVVRLYEFDCGRLTFDEPSAVFGISSDGITELFVPCYLVEHPDGRLLWEGGLPSDQVERPLSAQLAELGLTLDSMDYVAFSHMHFDHVGVANEIGEGVLLIQEAEFEAAFADEVTVPAFDPSLYDGLRELDRRLLDGDHDVFGDGTVRILAAPGHTPGHQALFVDLANQGPVVLSGDLYHFRESREERIVPDFNVDREATLRSMDRIEALVEETGAELWIEHDLARYQANAPAHGYYD